MKSSSIFCLSIILYFIVIATPAFADKPRTKGYYIDVTGQKKEIMMEVPTKMLNKKEVDNMQRNHFTVFDKRGKEQKLTAKDASEFGFIFDGQEYVFKLMPEVIQKVTHVKADFYRILMEGPCSVYLTFVSQDSYYLEYCLFKSDKEYFVTTTGVTNLLVQPPGRIMSMEKLFKDCPELQAKLKTKEYKKGDDRWLRAAQYYNQQCQGNSKGGGAGTETEGESESESE